MVDIFGFAATLAFAEIKLVWRGGAGHRAGDDLDREMVGIILCITCVIALIAGGPGKIAKISGPFHGLIFALFASPIITWVRSL